VRLPSESSHTGGRGQAGLAYAAFAAEQKNAHTLILDEAREFARPLLLSIQGLKEKPGRIPAQQA
jgi:predicted transcriptional regulator